MSDDDLRRYQCDLLPFGTVTLLSAMPLSRALDDALGRGRLVLSAPVFAELIAAPGRTEAFLNTFCSDTGILVEFDLDEEIWRLAGRAFQAYASRRRKQRGPRATSDPSRLPDRRARVTSRLSSLDAR